METILLDSQPISYDGVVLADREANHWQNECEGQLAARWPDFVDYKKRLETEGPFLLNILGERRTNVLDAAMGIGCESVFLAKRGFRVTGNEISPTFRYHAETRAQNEGISLEITAIDWRDLAAIFGENTFDAVLILGNSLCLLHDYKSRLQAVRNFGLVCAKGGTIIVDERNFDYILKNREGILKGNFRYSGKVMYCGTRVTGHPVIINSKCVRFTYEDNIAGNFLGHLDMHPFQKGEIVELFNQAGLTCVETYSDLVSGYRDDADFYTYVFKSLN